MAVVPMLRCDQCGKLADSVARPTTWRTMPLPFNPGVKVDVCSPGCAKREANGDIDLEWEKDDRGIPDSVVSDISSSQGSERLFEERAKHAVEVASYEA